VVVSAHDISLIAIICCGNRFYPGDDLGARVFDWLAAAGVPDGIALYDGGVAGLKLLALMEGRSRVVLVDSLEAEEFGAKIHVLDREQLAARAGNYGHGAGLPYLAAIAPHTLHPLPDILLVGSGGIHAAETVARTCLEVALYGRS
jgi:hydrogenase maturation protease